MGKFRETFYRITVLPSPFGPGPWRDDKLSFKQGLFVTDKNGLDWWIEKAFSQTPYQTLYVWEIIAENDTTFMPEGTGLPVDEYLLQPELIKDYKLLKVVHRSEVKKD